MKLSPNNDDRLWSEPEKTSWFHFASPMRYVVFIIVLVGVLIGLWYLTSPSRQEYDKANLPLIRADQTPYKKKAQSQGVPSVKHQDKLIYGRIRADQIEPVAEHILPDPEPPLPQIKEQNAPLKMIEEYVPEDIDLDYADETTKRKSEEKSSLTSIEDLIESIGDDKQKTAQKAFKGKIFIQLGSLKSYDMAESEWRRLSKKHSDVLGGLESVIQKVDLGEEQGIYYRLRTGPFDDMGKATEACETLKIKKVECVIIP